jgi:hypothetical protein
MSSKRRQPLSPTLAVRRCDPFQEKGSQKVPRLKGEGFRVRLNFASKIIKNQIH